jgi:hypothetical protein
MKKNPLNLSFSSSILFLLLIMVSSCIKEITIDFPNYEESVIVNSIFRPDSLIQIFLNKSQFILDTKKTTLSNATVYLFENNQILDTLIPKDSTYLSKYKPKPLTPYKIQIQHPDFQTDITAEDILPELPEFSNIHFEDSLYFGGEGRFFSQISIEIQDDPHQENFYELLLYLIKESDSFPYFDQSELYFDPVKNDRILLQESNLDFSEKNLLFSDQEFIENRHLFKINFRPFSYSFFNPNNRIYLIAKIRNVSKSYFNFKKQLRHHIEGGFYDIWDGTGEAIRLNGNIQNGYGIFAGYSEVIDTLQISN